MKTTYTETNAINLMETSVKRGTVALFHYTASIAIMASVLGIDATKQHWARAFREIGMTKPLRAGSKTPALNGTADSYIRAGLAAFNSRFNLLKQSFKAAEELVAADGTHGGAVEQAELEACAELLAVELQHEFSTFQKMHLVLVLGKTTEQVEQEQAEKAEKRKATPAAERAPKTPAILEQEKQEANKETVAARVSRLVSEIVSLADIETGKEESAIICAFFDTLASNPDLAAMHKKHADFLASLASEKAETKPALPEGKAGKKPKNNAMAEAFASAKVA